MHTPLPSFFHYHISILHFIHYFPFELVFVRFVLLHLHIVVWIDSLPVLRCGIVLRLIQIRVVEVRRAVLRLVTAIA